MKRIAAALVTLFTVTVAHAQDLRCDECAEAPGVDLRYRAPEPRDDLLGLEKAISRRNTGIGVTLAGIAATIAGGVSMGTHFDSLTIELGSTSIVGGAVAIGVGAGMWASGDASVRRAEGRAPQISPQMRIARGRRMKTAGIVLTAIGAALTVGAFVPLAVPQHCTDDLCGLGIIVESGATAAFASAFLGAGIPLLAVGVKDFGASFTIDGLSAQATQGGGRIGLSGRF